MLQSAVIGPPASFKGTLQHLLANRGHFNLAVYALIVCAWHAWDYHRKYRDREAETADLNMRLARAQLEALRMQLNPHFLFNTLNSISGLMLTDVTRANKMLSRLGELLRLTLETRDQQEVALSQELKFLNCYLEIQRIRFGTRLNVAMDIDPATLEARVPNLVLQPIAENAIRHTMEPVNGGGQVVFRALRQNGGLILEVADNGEGLTSQKRQETQVETAAGHRIGLENTRQRLQKLYGIEQSLALEENSEGGVTVSIRIPFRLTENHG
jgi:sensor histidine kinase YesM